MSGSGNSCAGSLRKRQRGSTEGGDARNRQQSERRSAIQTAATFRLRSAARAGLLKVKLEMKPGMNRRSEHAGLVAEILLDRNFTIAEGTMIVRRLLPAETAVRTLAQATVVAKIVGSCDTRAMRPRRATGSASVTGTPSTISARTRRIVRQGIPPG